MLGLRSRHTRREPRLDEEAMVVALVEHLDAHQLVNHGHRDVESRREGRKTAAIVGGCDADDGVATPSHSQRAADDLRVGAERALPVAVAEHHHRMAAPSDVVLGQNRSAEQRLDTEERKRASRHPLAHDVPCSATVIDRRAGERRCRDAAEDLGRTLAQVLDVRVRRRIEPLPAFGFVDVDERLGLHERGVGEEHRVNHAEDGRVRADADR